MRQFVRNLPALLSRTDVVLELRDSRLPLTSINHTFEGMWRVYLRIYGCLDALPRVKGWVRVGR